ncbi:MAG: hypothetical protein ACLSHC_16500 [Bilophila wadsworthia]
MKARFAASSLVSIMIMLMAQVVVRFAFGHESRFRKSCRFSFYLVISRRACACKGAHVGDRAHQAPAPVRVGLLMLADLLGSGSTPR